MGGEKEGIAAELGIKSLFRYSLPLFVTLVPLLVSNDHVWGSASNDHVWGSASNDVNSNDYVLYI